MSQQLLEVSTLCPHMHMHEDSQATSQLRYYVLNDALVHVMQNMQRMLLQSVDTIYLIICYLQRITLLVDFVSIDAGSHQRL